MATTETPTQSDWPCGLCELEAMSPDELLIEFVRTQDRVEEAVQEMEVLIRHMGGRLRGHAWANPARALERYRGASVPIIERDI